MYLKYYLISAVKVFRYSCYRFSTRGFKITKIFWWIYVVLHRWKCNLSQMCYFRLLSQLYKMNCNTNAPFKLSRFLALVLVFWAYSFGSVWCLTRIGSFIFPNVSKYFVLNNSAYPVSFCTLNTSMDEIDLWRTDGYAIEMTRQLLQTKFNLWGSYVYFQQFIFSH